MHKADPAVIAADLDRTRAIDPAYVLSGHLAPASGSMLSRMCDAIAAIPAAPPFAAPDQAALEAMLTAMAG
jgi:hypothetical protein